MLVESLEGWPEPPPGLSLLTLADFLREAPPAWVARVVNLCVGSTGPSRGLEASRLAEARGLLVQPEASVLAELGDLEALRRAGLPTPDGPPDQRRELLVLGGDAEPGPLRALALRVYRLWPHPALRLQLARRYGGWAIEQVEALTAALLDGGQRARLLEHLRRRDHPRVGDPFGFALAVLIDPTSPPSLSDPPALDRLARAAARMGVRARTLTPPDVGRLPEFDALFIRCSGDAALLATRHTRTLGMPTLGASDLAPPDDTPATWRGLTEQAGLPWASGLADLPSSLRWRVGVLDGRPLYALRSDAPGAWNPGEAVAVWACPPDVLALAAAAAAQLDASLVEVAVASPPTGPQLAGLRAATPLCAGVEDAAEGEPLYEKLLTWFEGHVDEARAAALRPRVVAPVPEVLEAARAPVHAATPSPPYALWSVVGLELEYALVDAELQPTRRVAELLEALRGQPCSELELGAVGLSYELFDHALEFRNGPPQESLVDAEAALVTAVQRVARVLDERMGLKLLPGGMHPWFDPRHAGIWARAERPAHAAWGRLLDLRTHGWANVQANHVNLPLGDEATATQMLNAAALLVPYLPALAASSPVVDGALQPFVDSRLRCIRRDVGQVPEAVGELVPEPITSLADHEARVLAPIWAALGERPDSTLLMREYINMRAAALRSCRSALELRVLDVQECVRADAAIAALCRAALRALVVTAPPPPDHALLVRDLWSCARDGGAASVEAPHLLHAPGPARLALERLLELAEPWLRPEERDAYMPLLIEITENGSLGERLRDRLRRASDLPRALRRVWTELAGCLVENEPWEGRR